MDSFKKKNIFQRLTMKQALLEEYYRALRKYEYETNAPIKDKKYYEKWHNFVKLVLDLEMKLEKQKVFLHKDLRTNKTNLPEIYAVTHVGRFDIEASFITRDKTAVYFWGDPGPLYKSPEKLLIDRVGAIFLDTSYREDCNVALQQMIRYLKEGHNIHINPEGAWNILPGVAVMKLYKGIVIAAMETGALVVPEALVFYDNNWYVSYGEEFEIKPFNDIAKEKNIDESNYETEKQKYIMEQLDVVREKMATLRWDLIIEYSGTKQYLDESKEFVYTTKRSSLTGDVYEEFLKPILKGCSHGYGLQEIEDTRYKDSYTRTKEEIDRDLENLKNKNAILSLNKKIK